MSTPPPTFDFAGRRERLRQALRDAGRPAALLLTAPEDVYYLTGFSGDAGYALLLPDRVAVLTDGRFTTQLAQEAPDAEAFIRPGEVKLPPAAGGFIKALGVAEAGFDPAGLSLGDWTALTAECPAVSWRPDGETLPGLRVVKDDAEVDVLRRAVGVAERAFGRFREELDPAKTERQLAGLLDYLMRDEGADASSFPTIVAAGPHAALPHAQPGDRRFADFPLLLVDWGARVAGYHSDLTRVLVREPADEELRRAYRTVYEAKALALTLVRPGANAREVDAAVRKHIEEAGYAGRFTHGTGHGLGLRIHERPFLGQSGTDTLAAGMVVTVEPGVYLPGRLGVRLEDDVLVTADGCQVLSLGLPHAPDDMLGAA